MATRRRRRTALPTIGRDTVIVAVALGLIVHEAVLREGDGRPFLIGLFAAMLGLPAIVRADAVRRDQLDDEKPDA